MPVHDKEGIFKGNCFVIAPRYYFNIWTLYKLNIAHIDDIANKVNCIKKVVFDGLINKLDFKTLWIEEGDFKLVSLEIDKGHSVQMNFKQFISICITHHRTLLLQKQILEEVEH